MIGLRAKAVAHKFSDTFYNGDVGVDPKSFDGLHVSIPAGQTITPGVNGGAITLPLMDELIDKTWGKPDVLLMSKRTRRKLKDLRRTSGTVLETSVDQFGERIEYYDGIPLLVDDFISDAKTQGTGTNLSTVYALKFGMGVGAMGLEHGGVVVDTIGELETKDATRNRIKWYAGLALFNERGAAKMTGITA